MTKCNRCEKLPETSSQNGTLFISPPMMPTKNTIDQILKNNLIQSEEITPEVTGIKLNNENRKKLCSLLNKKLSDLELKDTKCLFIPEGVSLSPEHLVNVNTLDEYVCMTDNLWLSELLDGERIETWFHPIVSTENPDQVFAYECLSRGINSDGTTVFPKELFHTARSANLLFYLDRLCRQSAVKNAARNGIIDKLFINFIPTVIYDPAHCLRTTLETIEQTGFKRENVVFEVIETDQVEDIDHLLNIIDFYRKNGFMIALDDLGAGYGSLNLLHQIKPDFIKIDMELIRDVDKDNYKGIIVQNILSLASELKIKSIAEGVERKGEWQWLKDKGATYIQGYLFAKPAPVPPLPEILDL